MVTRGFWLLAGALFLMTPGGWASDVVINEVAWSGAPTDLRHEWIELFNTTEQTVSLTGWRLTSSDGCPDAELRGSIPPLGFYLLARDHDDVLPNVRADLIYPGALNDGGEILYLLDGAGNVVDTVNEGGDHWPAGTDQFGVPPCCSMERIDPTTPDEPANWSTFDPPSYQDTTPIIRGSPKATNSRLNCFPRVAFSIDPIRVHLNEAVTFNALASHDPDGTITSFLWNFGDGTQAEGPVATHVYREDGEFTVCLAITDNRGKVVRQEETIRVIDNKPPTVDFSIKPCRPEQEIQTLNELVFMDESFDRDGAITAWTWTFGDGESASTHTALHTYKRPGTYTIKLCVTDDQGDSACQSQSLLIGNRAPEAVFTYAPTLPNAGDAVAFDASSSRDPDGALVAYEWDFDGDDVPEVVTDQPKAEYAFTEEGDHSVSLRVRDEAGAMSPPMDETVHVNESPVASFQVSDFSPDENEEVHFTDLSYDVEGEIVSWRWQFGDNGCADLRSPSHLYREDGVYIVTLTVVDEQGTEGVTSVEITVKNLLPHAVLNFEGATERQTGEPIVFDASGSHDPSPQGQIIRYEWDLNGEGTYSEVTASGTFRYSYADNGTYQVRVRVVDDDEGTDISDPVTVEIKNRPPSCAFEWVAKYPTDGEDVTFFDRSTDADGAITSWRWDFGDGRTSDEPHPMHAFPDGGTYTVSLTVCDDDGASASCSFDVRVSNARPLAVFEMTPASPRRDEVVKFVSLAEDPSPTGRIVHISWDFGDGTHCPGRSADCGEGGLLNPTHIYHTSGVYTITLVVIDEEGALGRISQTITVTK